VIPQANITAWRAKAPWPDDAQVEQDLVLTRALVELFRVPRIRDSLAFRGGTVLHKLFFDPPGRYSEDIDLVQRTAGPIGPVLDAVRMVLDPWLGEPRRERGKGMVTLFYRFETTGLPARTMRLKVEINTREHFAVLGHPVRRIVVDSPWFAGEAEVPVYELEELLATKLRALYQRKKGRDLYDLWLGLQVGAPGSREDRIVTCFLHYMRQGGTSVSRAEFEMNLEAKRKDTAFLGDIMPLLPAGVVYDPVEALDQVLSRLIAKLPGAPWKGAGVTD
jgi:predicted nucleotidyltransferase component of viral defense system